MRTESYEKVIVFDRSELKLIIIMLRHIQLVQKGKSTNEHKFVLAGELSSVKNTVTRRVGWINKMIKVLTIIVAIRMKINKQHFLEINTLYSDLV